ncbi:MATE family efflux transporter [Hespellia stercorisuis]|uniref:Multidrug export protein MepA n=1 Tax=Hespellia stercorisuis DSM 15480 TaxID=1121950 RepID=A0A1M6IKH7_9FIRM|nr:MATE family efflux transporter [Hespellia stercorisuis]SHJ35022.1 putative efflux protein, MATE family [Hespellia stercorisuis DSM 15480]
MAKKAVQDKVTQDRAVLDKTTEIFRDAPVSKAVISNVVPSIISMLMVLVYNLADTFFIGQTHNALMVAAVSVATPAFLLFMAVGMLFGIGGTSLISRMLGEGKHEKAKHTSSFCFWTGLGIGVIAMVVIWIFARPICRTIGASDDTIGYASQYLNIVAVGIPFLIVSNTFSNIIRSEGNAKTAMMGMIIGNMINVVLDPVMILLLDWNVAGAAIATVIGNIFSAGFYLRHLVSEKSILSVRLKDYKMRDGVAKGVLAIGVPASLNNILMSVSNIIINNVMAAYGDMAVAGLGVAMKVNMIAVMLLIGLGTGIQPLLGYCYGAGNRKRYLSVLKFSLGLAFSLSIVMTVICYCGAGPLVKAFLQDSDAFAYGMSFARIYIYSGPVLGILFVFINAIQSTGASLPSLVLSISRQGLLYVPILLIFREVFDSARMLAAAQPVTDYLAAALSVVLFVFTYRKYFKHFAKN